MALFALTACNESDDEPQDASNGSQVATILDGESDASDAETFKMLIDNGDEKAWSASAFTLAGLNSFQTCRLDDQMVFNSDGTYLYDGGDDLCGDEDNARVKSGTWEIDFENQSVIFDKETTNEETAVVIGLNENEIRLQGSYMMMQVRGVYTAN